MHLFSRWSKREGSTRRRGGGKGGGEGCEDGSARRWTPPHLPGLRGALSLSVQMWVSSSWPGTNQEVTTSHAASTWGPRHFRYSLLPLYLVRFSTIRAVISRDWLGFNFQDFCFKWQKGGGGLGGFGCVCDPDTQLSWGVGKVFQLISSLKNKVFSGCKFLKYLAPKVREEATLAGSCL